MKRLSRLTYRIFISIFIIGLTVQLMPVQSVFSDSKPVSTTEPATVSADALPTVQIDGIIKSQAIINNTVYAVGKFTTARPAGVALGGAGSVARANILAYDITTGQLNTSFVHKLEGTNAEGNYITVSPDKSKIFVGGLFTSVDGQARNNLVVFNAATGAMLSGYPGTNNVIKTMAASNTKLYVGGIFSLAAGVARKNLAAYNTSNGSLLTTWSATPSHIINAMILTPDGTKLVIGGPFTQVSGQTFYGSAALDINTGTPLPWASSSPDYKLQNYDLQGSSSSILHFFTNGSLIFASSFNYKATSSTNWGEGPVAINPTNGAIAWINDCHGDTYASFVQNNVLYSVGHAHDCSAMGGFPEKSSDISHNYATAYTLTPNGTNGSSTNGYPQKMGVPKTTLLNWFPRFNTNTIAGQAGWTITGNGNYLAIGGEFTTVNGKPQQGLVRFAPAASGATNKIGPKGYGNGPVVRNGPVMNGSVVVTVKAAYDDDNSSLTYKFYRDGGSTVIKTITTSSNFWDRQNITFTDTGVAAGAHTYRVVVTDAFGNSLNGGPLPTTACHGQYHLSPINSLCPNEFLNINQSLYSNNGKYRLTMHSDGNLVLFSNGIGVWSTHTSGIGYAKFILQADGNIAVNAYDRGITHWNLNQSFPSPLGFVLQDDGNMGIYNTNGQAMWASSTNGL